MPYPEARVATSYDSVTCPRCWVIDPTGMIRYVNAGPDTPPKEILEAGMKHLAPIGIRAESRHQIGIEKEPLERPGEPAGVAGRCQKTGHAILDQFRDAAHSRRHRRHTARGRFHEADWHSFAVARKHRHRRAPPPRQDLGLLRRPN